MITGSKHPFFICRYDRNDCEMQFVHAYNPKTNDIEIRNGDNDNILYFATDDIAVEIFNLIKDKLPAKDDKYIKNWFVKQSVRPISFHVDKKRMIIGYKPKTDCVQLITKRGKVFNYVFQDLTDRQVEDKMLTIALGGCERYGIPPREIASIETVCPQS